jgi:hypothetical protein
MAFILEYPTTIKIDKEKKKEGERERKKKREREISSTIVNYLIINLHRDKSLY